MAPGLLSQNSFPSKEPSGEILPGKVNQFEIDQKLLIQNEGKPLSGAQNTLGKEIEAGLFQIYPGGVTYALAFSPDGKSLAVAGDIPGIRVYSIETGLEDHFLNAHETPVKHLVYSADGESLISGSSREVRIWDTITGDQQESMALEEDLKDLALSSDGSWLTLATDQSLKSHFLLRPGVTSEIPGLQGIKKIANIGDFLWVSLQEGKLIRFRISDHSVAEVRESPSAWCFDLKALNYPPGILLAGDFPEIKFLPKNPKQLSITGETLARDYRGHVGWVKALALHPNGNQFASGGALGKVNIWSFDDKKPKHTFLNHQEEIFAIEYSPDGSWLATAGKDEMLLLRDLRNLR